MSAETIKNQVDSTKNVLPNNNSQSQIIYKNAANIKIKAVHWLWKGRIARGKSSIIAGDPGLGKSQLMANLAATVTIGGIFPGDSVQCEAGGVIFLSAEDDPADTIVPRLIAAGADIKLVNFIEAVSTGSDEQNNPIHKHFNLATDLIHLDVMLNELKNTALIIIDPITAYLGGKDGHKTAEVRALLAPLQRVAEQYNVAIVCISHLNKGGGGEALTRVTGSMAFVAAARAAYLVAKDKKDPSRRLFLPLKNNLGGDQTGLSFSIETVQIEDEEKNKIETSKIVWSSEVVNITADEALTLDIETGKTSAQDKAEEFLKGLLINGPVPSTRVEQLSKDAGHSIATIRRAKDALKIEPKKTKDGWLWEMRSKTSEPTEHDQDAQDDQTKSLNTLSTLNAFTDRDEEDTLV